MMILKIGIGKSNRELLKIATKKKKKKPIVKLKQKIIYVSRTHFDFYFNFVTFKYRKYSSAQAKKKNQIESSSTAEGSKSILQKIAFNEHFIKTLSISFCVPIATY